jgi:type IV secretion system protein VirB2
MRTPSPRSTVVQEPTPSKVAIASIILLLAIFLLPGIAHASDTGMPWEGPLNRVIASLTGPVARGIGVLAIVGAGLAIAFGEGGAGVKRLLQVVLGLSIAFTASSFLLSLFGVANGYSL